LFIISLFGAVDRTCWAQEAADRPTCAVQSFKNDTDRPESAYLASVIGQSLPSALARTGAWQLVEREQLKTLLDEADLKDSDIVEGKPIRLKGVQLFVFGKYRDEGGMVTVTARLVEAATSNRVREAAWSGHVSGLTHGMAQQLAAQLAGQDLPSDTLPPPMQEQFKKACRLLEEKKIDQAIKVCDQILDQHRKHVATLLVRGHAELHKKGWDRQAIKDFQAVLEIDDSNMAAVLGLAAAKMTDDRRSLEESLGLLKEALRKQPDCIEVLCPAAVVLSQLGKTAEAMEYAKRATAAMPEYSPAWQTLARLELAQGAVAQAVDSATKATTYAPGDPFAWKLLGDAQFAAKNQADARQSYRKALQCNPPPDLKKELDARLQKYN
jgi:TolB-like protein/Flp pilus assembly protein TadD